MSVRDDIKEQRQKLKGQGFKAYWDYYWEYYKIHTIVAIVALIFIGITIKDISNNKPYALYAMCVNNHGMDTQQYLQDGFIEYAGIDSSSFACLVDTSSNYLNSTLDNTSVATSEKIMATMAAHELDVMVADENTIGRYASQDTFMDLRQVYSIHELEQIQDKIFYVDQGYIDYLASDEYSDYLLTQKIDESNKYAVMARKYDEDFIYEHVDPENMDDPIPVGIILDDSSALEACSAYPDEPAIAAIIINTNRIDMSREFINYLRK